MTIPHSLRTILYFSFTLGIGAFLGLWGASHSKTLASLFGTAPETLATNTVSPQCVSDSTSPSATPLFINCGGFLE